MKSDANKATLDAVSLEIKAGEKVGICGRTGRLAPLELQQSRGNFS